jgi:hypothetical protein
MGCDERMKFWERPFFRLLSMFVLLGLFAWWTFQTVSLPPTLRDLFEEDGAMAAAAQPMTEEQSFQQELNRLPATSQNHAPEVAALLQRLKNLPPPPYLLQAARQRDSSTRSGEAPLPWNQAELAAEEAAANTFLAAWEPFLQGPPVAWENYPDSARLFRSSLLALLQEPGGGKSYSELLLLPDYQLIKKLQGLGTLRFGVLSSWSSTDTVKLSEILVDQLRTFEGSDLELRTLRANYPLPPTIEQLRRGLRIDREMFLAASRYLTGLPRSTRARAGLTAYLGDAGDASWFVSLLPEGSGEASVLASLLSQSDDQILELEQKTYFTGPAWRQWLEGSPTQGLSPWLANALEGMKAFESVRLHHQVSIAFLDAALAYRESGLDAARRIPDPAQPGKFLEVEVTGGKTIISTSWSKNSSTPPPSLTLFPASPAP